MNFKLDDKKAEDAKLKMSPEPRRAEEAKDTKPRPGEIIGNPKYRNESPLFKMKNQRDPRSENLRQF